MLQGLAIATAVGKIRKLLLRVPRNVWLWIAIASLIVAIGIVGKIVYSKKIEEAEQRGILIERQAVNTAALEQSAKQQERVNVVEKKVVETREVVRAIREKGEDNVQIVYRDLPAQCGISAPGVQVLRDLHSSLDAAAAGFGDDSL